MPSPVATAGLVVSRNTWPAPPVASSVARGAHLVRPRRHDRKTARRRPTPSSTRQLGDERVIDGLHRRQRRDALPQHAADLAAGRIAGVQNAPDRVRGFAAERGPAVSLAIEPGAPLRQFLDVVEARPRRAPAPPPRRTIRRRRGSCPRREGRRAVVGTDSRGDAALRVTGVALGGIRLGEDEDAAGSRERERRAQPRDAAADDQKIRGSMVNVGECYPSIRDARGAGSRPSSSFNAPHHQFA